ncbi:MAG: GspE/PulE family protein [Opitutales bacterium]
MTTADDFVLQILQDRNLVTAETVEAAREAVEQQDPPPENPDDAAIQWICDQGHLNQHRIIEALADEFSMDVVDLNDIRVSHEILGMLDRKMAERYRVFPMEYDGTTLEIATADPLDVDSVDSLSHLLKCSIHTHLTTPAEIDHAIEQYYDSPQAEEIDSTYRDIFGESDVRVDLDHPADENDEDKAPIIRYVKQLITEAIKRRASDIHLEPLEREFRVRYRIDGVLQKVESPPKRLQPAILTRLKLTAGVSIAEKRVPQDGRIQMKTESKEIDLRVSALPTVYGESIVMRILDKEGLNLGLPQLGFFSDDQAAFERIISFPDGIFLVTGPTGSGKSTTLYSALNYVNHPDRKLITVEDPVEYQMTGINQVQVRREVGMTFAAALRSMLRQAPNVIMVGEIRDLETAEIAVNASLTGHMVFSTLHTNDAPSAVSRLVDIGVKPFLVSASLRGAMAQRLVRRICQNCKVPYTPRDSELISLGVSPGQTQDATFFEGQGCPKCNHLGYRGRMGIFEMFLVTEEVAQMIYENRTLVELREKAIEGGMRTMREDGFRKIAAGSTTFAEVLHVTVGDFT